MSAPERQKAASSKSFGAGRPFTTLHAPSHLVQSSTVLHPALMQGAVCSVPALPDQKVYTKPSKLSIKTVDVHVSGRVPAAEMPTKDGNIRQFGRNLVAPSDLKDSHFSGSCAARCQSIPFSTGERKGGLRALTRQPQRTMIRWRCPRRALPPLIGSRPCFPPVSTGPVDPFRTQAGLASTRVTVPTNYRYPHSPGFDTISAIVGSRIALAARPFTQYAVDK